MEITKTLTPTSRKAWRSWLAKNHKTKAEIWLVFYRKETGKQKVSYDDAVEEALCYGWIDGIVKKLDAERFAQRFTPRSPRSNLSAINKKRVDDLVAKKLMTKAGLDAIAHAYKT